MPELMEVFLALLWTRNNGQAENTLWLQNLFPIKTLPLLNSFPHLFLNTFLANHASLRICCGITCRGRRDRSRNASVCLASREAGHGDEEYPGRQAGAHGRSEERRVGKECRS